MTRQEFDTAFSARSDNTAGYSQTELRNINDGVFLVVADLDITEDGTKSFVDYHFERAFAAMD